MEDRLNTKFKIHFKYTSDPTVAWGPCVFLLERDGYVALPAYGTVIEDGHMTIIIRTNCPKEELEKIFKEYMGEELFNDLIEMEEE